MDNQHERTLVTKLARNTILLGEEVKEKGLYLSVDLFFSPN